MPARTMPTRIKTDADALWRDDDENDPDEKAGNRRSGKARDALAQAAAGKELEILAQEIEREEEQPEASEDGSRGQHGSWIPECPGERPSRSHGCRGWRRSRKSGRPRERGPAIRRSASSRIRGAFAWRRSGERGGWCSTRSSRRPCRSAAVRRPCRERRKRLFELWRSRRIRDGLAVERWTGCLRRRFQRPSASLPPNRRFRYGARRVSPESSHRKSIFWPASRR